MSLPVQVYTADSSDRSIRRVLGDIVQGFLSSRYTAYRLARRDIKDAYSSSVLGLLWDFLEPLIFAGMFYYLMKSSIISSDNLGMPASVFVVVGMMLYQSYTDALLLTTESLNRSRNLTKFPKVCPEAIILSVFYRVMFNSIFRVVIIFSFLIVSGNFSLTGAVVFLFLFPVIIFWGMAPGILLSPFNVIFNDIGRIVKILLLPLRFLAPVIYAIPASSTLGKLQIFNPVTMPLDNLRAIVVGNAIVHPQVALLQFLLLCILGLVGVYIYHLSVPILSERS